VTRYFLRSKIHRAVVTARDQHYEGSISLGPKLCRAAGLLEMERVDIYDVTNGSRFTTYVIFGEEGEVKINGAAALLVKKGDLIIVAAYAGLGPREIASHRAVIVHVDPRNLPIRAERHRGFK
jgi:aspartate 1-decarboxylase